MKSENRTGNVSITEIGKIKNNTDRLLAFGEERWIIGKSAQRTVLGLIPKTRSSRPTRSAMSGGRRTELPNGSQKNGVSHTLAILTSGSASWWRGSSTSPTR